MDRMIIGLLGAGLFVGSAFGGTKMLSTQNDTRDGSPKSAAKKSSDSTSFWGMATVLGGTKDSPPAEVEDALELLRPYAARPGNFYNAALYGHHQRPDHGVCCLHERLEWD